MGATADARISRRRINEMEERLKRLQRDLHQLKSETKKIGQLRKQTKRAMHAESECRDVLDYVRENYDIDDPKEDVQEKSEYRCRNEDCLNAGGFYGETGECDIIEAGVRLVVVCRDCGSRYTVSNG